jgi:hypothetical protein
MRNLLATLALLMIVVVVGLYAAGWLQYRTNESSATIEIQTQNIENAAGRAVEDGRELLEEVIEQPVHTPAPSAPKPKSPDDLESPVTQQVSQFPVMA